MPAHDLIVVGTSAGGVEALKVLAGGLPADLAAAVLVVMHSSAQGPYLLPEILSKIGLLKATKVVDGTRIENGKIYIAPPDHHLLVNGRSLSLSRGPKENRSRPAIDPLFRTAAASYGPRVIGVILTGMLDDGTAGLSAVKQRGGITVVQDPKDALYSSMPKSALRFVGADHTAPIAGIATLLARLVKDPTTTPENLPVSRLIALESKFVRMEAMNMEDMDTIGAHAGVSCPECHGPVWKINDGTLERYRCHVGHAYTAQSMVEGQIEAQETHLWQALRLMKERVSLMRAMSGSAMADPAAVRTRDAEVAQLEKNIAAIQAMVQEQLPSPATERAGGNGDTLKGEVELPGRDS
jgi:two-component system, chemotaxis family, protein-glutamate methylesterase/glutaminase